ncbi:MAG: hypothetical protein IBJ00_08180 [Alphaproteobacteria bacterium]|nr:hypothetical protein [Alphaproteobacteria bacterium]
MEALTRLTSLIALDMENNEISNAGIEFAFEVNRLTSLTLENNRIAMGGGACFSRRQT